MSYAELPCKKAVTLLTDFMEGSLGTEERAALERHLVWCDWCMTYFSQLRDTVRAAASLRAEDTPAPVGDDLLAAFRAQRGGAGQS